MCAAYSVPSAVSIRAPLTRAGRRVRPDNWSSRYLVSIRAPLTRAGRQEELHGKMGGTLFQSAPRSRERGDRPSAAKGVCHLGFNPRPAHASGATRNATPPTVSIAAFQSAPRSRERGDGPVAGAAGAPRLFQSAPRSRERGDRASVEVLQSLARFQSAPRSRERGDLVNLRASRWGRRVSIRAPLTRAGRRTSSDTRRELLRFQSAPRSRERGDEINSSIFGPVAGFQSAPRSRERGDGCLHTSSSLDSGVSIRAPLTRAGRREQIPKNAKRLLFQSAPRSRERGDWLCGYFAPAVDEFQSAPRSRERGDHHSTAFFRSPASFNPRPAHASGATLCQVELYSLVVGFNPRPAHASGATVCQVGESINHLVVSIRAPLTRAGRRITHVAIPMVTEFQSAPRSRERGDGNRTSLTGFRPCFNPRPAHASGATASRGTDSLMPMGFNPRPAHASGATYSESRLSSTLCVSIRAPLTRAGRPVDLWPGPLSNAVSIRAPLTRAGRQAPASPLRSQLARFNPRPAHASGATCGGLIPRCRFDRFQSAPRSRERGDPALPDDDNSPWPVSIRAPLTRAGRLGNAHGPSSPMTVSIRAPLTRAGRLSGLIFHFRFGPFQSAPRSRERGDMVIAATTARQWSFNPRPAHASGATWYSLLWRPRRRCFNPRPAHASGATWEALSIRRDRVVSIRAPLTRAGRRNVTPPTVSIAPFQSAPRSRERGDSRLRRRKFARTCFNPRPAHASGATSDITALVVAKFVSIRAPLTRAGRLRSCLATEPHGFSTPFSPTCQPFSHRRVFSYQRTITNCYVGTSYAAARNPGCRAVAWGSRSGGHNTNGSLRFNGLSTPWCSIRWTAFSSRK